MKLTRPLLFLSFVFCSFSSVRAQDVVPHPLKDLVGTWEYSSENGRTVESWKLLNDSTCSGFGLFIKSTGDTAFQENLRIFKSNNFWYYGATVPNQNDGEEIAFRLSEREDATWYFENKEHDFPQKICYTLKSPSALFVWIEGKTDDGTRREYFHFEKVN